MVLPIYYDDIFKGVLERGSTSQLTASRGRDIPKIHTRKKPEPGYDIPYITSGRSVRRYHINEQHVSFTNDWFLQDSALKDSFENELLVATKNYRYPRCVLKPKGVIHGGGIVNISPQYDNADLRVLGLILNSKLIRQICVRYLTNYSQLTCCLNTGIMEELPLIVPDQKEVYSILFDSLTSHYSGSMDKMYETANLVERFSDALVYSLYFGDGYLEGIFEDCFSEQPEKSMTPDDVVEVLDKSIQREVEAILEDSTVRELERLCNFPPSEKSLRY
jgi:hypothetical protein